jgi:hypothetical protein
VGILGSLKGTSFLVHLLHGLPEKAAEEDMNFRLLQEDCKLSTRELASKVGSPVTTVYAKMRRMEDLGQELSGLSNKRPSLKVFIESRAFPN